MPAQDFEFGDNIKSKVTDTGKDTADTANETELKADEKDLGNHRVVGPKEPNNQFSRALQYVTKSLQRSANSQGERSLNPNKRATSEGVPSPSAEKSSNTLCELIGLECRVAYINLRYM
jgi:hypothetical protein